MHVRAAAAGLLTFLSLAPVAARAEPTRLTNPNAVSVELFGRGMMYSLSYDRVLNDDMVAGLGFGTVSTQDQSGADTGVTAVMIPAYVNYYFSRDQGSVFVTGGAALVTNSSSVQGFKTAVGGLNLPGGAIVGQFGAGYESRGDSGFLFRLTAYGMIGTKVVPWVGFTFGYAF